MLETMEAYDLLVGCSRMLRTARSTLNRTAQKPEYLVGCQPGAGTFINDPIPEGGQSETY